MLKRLRFKASLPALISGGTKKPSGFAPNAPFANGGQRLNTRNSYIISSSKRIYTSVQWVNLHTAADSQQSLEFQRHAIDVIDKLKAPLPSTTETDDDFDELGPSVSGESDSGSVLSGESDSGSVLSGESDSGSVLSKKESKAQKTTQEQGCPVKLHVAKFPTKQDKCHPGGHFNTEGQTGALRSKTKAGKQKSLSNNNKNQSSYLFIFSIESIPPNISPQELREALSVYGEILSFSMRVGADGLASCHVKFKSLEAKTRALAARWITIKDARLPIRGLLDRHDYILIRIANISMDTTEVAIHSICTSFGEVLGLARTKEGAADVMFRVKDFEVSQSIAKHLSDVVIDDRRWSAKLQTKLDDATITNAADSQRQVGLQITSHLESFRNQLNMQRIYVEDLENLHHAVLHLRNSPPNL